MATKPYMIGAQPKRKLANGFVTPPNRGRERIERRIEIIEAANRVLRREYRPKP
jgi:hypothetical protein